MPIESKTATTFPKGAFTSVQEFQDYCADVDARTIDVWEASRKFGMVEKREATGNIKITRYPGGDEYVAVETRTDNGGTKDNPAARDRHLLPQDYNDWYLFRSEADARAYVDGTTDFILALAGVSVEIAKWADDLLRNGASVSHVRRRLREIAAVADAQRLAE